MVNVAKYTTHGFHGEGNSNPESPFGPTKLCFTGRIGNPLHEAFFVWSWTSGAIAFLCKFSTLLGCPWKLFSK